MNKHDVTISNLHTLGFSRQEASIYLTLLSQPATHAQLSTTTNINRTTLYRLVGKLEKRGLVIHRVDDHGKYLIAADPSTLEAEVVTQEAHVKQQRAALGNILPSLESLQHASSALFAIHTYEGVEGFKRMLWHELKARDDCLLLGYNALEDLIPNHEWAERFRQRTVEAGYRIREIGNPGTLQEVFTDNHAYLAHYEQRMLPNHVLPVNHHIAVYNDVVAIYHTKEGKRIGLEITGETFAQTIRSIFELYWRLATNKPPS